jgi:hypothetical protein
MPRPFAAFSWRPRFFVACTPTLTLPYEQGRGVFEIMFEIMFENAKLFHFWVFSGFASFVVMRLSKFETKPEEIEIFVIAKFRETEITKLLTKIIGFY